MPSQFASLSSQEKLKILETAVGFETYRANVIEARRKLNSILSEEESIKDLLDRARETLGYWREQNERLQDKLRHQKRSSFLQQELAWSKVSYFEMTIDGLNNEIAKANMNLKKAEHEIENNGKMVFNARNEIAERQRDWLELIDVRIDVEKKIGVCEYFLKNSEENIQRLNEIIDSSKANQKKIEVITETLKTRLKVGPTTLDDYFKIIDEIELNQSESFRSLQTNLIEQVSGINESMEFYLKELNDENSNLKLIISSIVQIQEKLNNINEEYIEARIRMAILKDNRERITRLINKLEVDLEKLKDELDGVKVEAILKGSRVDTGRSQDEILDEIRRTTGILLALSDVSENAQVRYESYSKTYNDLQEKIELVRESRRKVLQEIEERTRKWLEVMRELLEEVNNRYKVLLSELQAQGEVRITNTNDVDESGLEIWVGFRGAKPSQLDPYTHSGGERSASVMAFLLALQQNIKSPFRAVDEFDLHMDPKNREVVSNFIFEALKGSRNQYIAITPSQMAFRDRDVHIIMVNKTENTSKISLVE
jgi:chromosome segregation ATPase